MKRLVSILIAIGVLVTNTCIALASENEQIDLIARVEETRIETKSDFVSLLEECGYDEPVCVNTHTLTYVSDLEELSCNVEIDYVNDEVIVDTVYLTQASATRTSGRVTREVYSSLGMLIYTLTVEGTFSRTSQSVTTVSATGTFQKGNASFWSSTPTTSQGNISTTKAYARISGTASWLLQSRTYQLTLMCDTNGTLTSSYSE